MMKIPVVSLALAFSCSSPEKSQIKSAWVDLKAAAQSECKPWPMEEKDLELQTLLPVEGESGLYGFLNTIKRRNSSLAHAFVPARGNLNLNMDDAIVLPLGQTSVLLAGWMVGSTAIAVTAVNSGTRATLEARNVKDNRVVAKSQFVLDENVRDADIAIDGNDMWLSLRTGDYSTVFARLQMKGSNGQFEKVGLPSESRGAVIVVDRETHTPYIVESQPNSDRVSLKVSQIKIKDFSQAPAQQLQIEAKGGVESWAVSSGSGGLYFGAVTGDSMVGQSHLLAALIETKSNALSWGWQKVTPLPDIHVSEPVWADSKMGAQLTIMKWLEGEATMGLYTANRSGFVVKSDRGVYPKGSIVLSAFPIKENTVGTVVRQRRDDLWVYTLCGSDL